VPTPAGHRCFTVATYPVADGVLVPPCGLVRAHLLIVVAVARGYPDSFTYGLPERRQSAQEYRVNLPLPGI